MWCPSTVPEPASSGPTPRGRDEQLHRYRQAPGKGWRRVARFCQQVQFFVSSGTLDRPPPRFIQPVPLDRFGETSIQMAQRFPTDLGADLCRVDRVPAIMSRAIGHELDQLLAPSQMQKNRPNQVQIGALVICTYIVDFTGTALHQNIENGRTMILDMNPVADVQPITVDWDW